MIINKNMETIQPAQPSRINRLRKGIGKRIETAMNNKNLWINNPDT
jgi:hypothetical protein